MKPARHPRRVWHALELAFVREHYPHFATEDIAHVLGRPVRQVYSTAYLLGVHKTHEYLASAASGRIRGQQHTGRLHRFPKGHVPWNKGRPMPEHVRTAAAATQFKPGHRPQTWVPVGSTRLSKDRTLQVKLTDTGYTPRDWVPLALLVWEAAHGPAPAGHVVVARPPLRIPTNPLAICAADLECITRAELMRRNSIHARLPKPLVEVARLRGALKRQINRLAAKEAAPHE